MRNILTIITLLFLSSSVFAQSSKKANVQTDETEKHQTVREDGTVQENGAVGIVGTADEAVNSDDAQLNFYNSVKDRFTEEQIKNKTTKYKKYLRETISNKKASQDVRKRALFMLYGEQYTKHMDEILELPEDRN